MPRRYNLGRRALQVQDTRRRIIEAAGTLYQAQGVSATSMQEVARQADVAPGTVLNHFASPDELARAVVDQVVGSLHLPTEGVFEGLDTVPDRVSRLARELFAFYDRSEVWYQVYSREPNGVPAWADAEAAFYAEFDRLIQLSLGPLATDHAAVAAVSTMLGAGVHGSLRTRGLPTQEAAELVADLLSSWLAHKVVFAGPGLTDSRASDTIREP